MNDGEISAWHFETRKPVRVRWANGVITEVGPATSEQPKNLWVAPGLVDLQVNGFAGIDFQQDDLTVEDLLTAARELRVAGCTRFLLTLITDEWTKLTARLRHLRRLRMASSELQSTIVGWHIEGPFLSSKPGFHGAHEPALMLDPKPAHIRELRELIGDDPLLLTVAPERAGALEAIALAVSMGIKVSLGHTDASADILKSAVQAGATGFTHLGNGCPRELDRFDNILWRVLETPGLTVGIIPDGIHVSPALFRLMHRLFDAGAIYYTTDAMSAAGAPPGRYKLGRLEMEVGADQIVRQPGKTNLAGSALRPYEGFFRAARMLNGAWQDAWVRASQVPAKFMGLPSGLEAGSAANFCVLKLEDAGERMVVRGNWTDSIIFAGALSIRSIRPD